MLANTQDARDLDIIRSQGNGCIYRVDDRKTVLGSQSTAHISFRNLIGKQRRQMQIRSGSAILLKTLQDLSDDHIRMRLVAIFSDDRRNR